MFSIKEKSEISLCALSMDRVMPSGFVEILTATVRKGVGLASSIKSVLYFFTALGLTLSLPAAVFAQVQESGTTVFAQVQKIPSLEEALVEGKSPFLFVLSADTGVITKTDGGYKLTLKGMDDKVMYFSDRPQKFAGYITLTQFMGTWAEGKDSFKDNPPNAVINVADLKTSENGIAQTIPVMLMNPVVTANGWTFDLKGLQGEEIPVGSYKGISVFIA